MQLSQIKAELANPDPMERLQAILALKNYEAEIAMPLLLSQLQEKEYLVRSFVAMALGKQRTEQAFAALLEMMKFDVDPHVRAEAANSLSLFEQLSVSHLVATFYQDDHWLVRCSIIAALAELNCPQALLEVCTLGVNEEELSVQEACVNALCLLANTPKQQEALTQILSKVNDPSWRVRVKVIDALGHFDRSQAQSALHYLSKDVDHRVAEAALKKLAEI
ncbi:HEAT repeat domain-containing protein [Gloeothece verrucosa]|uniref:PBS lyase HEAT domain protein repeat-containing protein n=1 Tax=Gloeothece verrucosa (strain PCC 7822) TaxID=497965 RepID=E0U6S5_GLOV7|nr:HEAT repeat domain-containing protein [Gloeothece verrucosa]ADN15962.1 PBS lyase HEAT domain protein repeat-containing protein [Gloeothece verrucosa PCC 7822]